MSVKKRGDWWYVMFRYKHPRDRGVHTIPPVDGCWEDQA